MHLEVAYIVAVTKLMKYVTCKEDPVIQIVRMDQHITDSALLQTEASRENHREEQDKRKMEREEDKWAVPT